MPTCGQNYVILASYCRHIDFKLHLYISFIFATINKKTHANIFILKFYYI